MEINQSLADKFFQNRCTTEEVELMLQYIAKHPEALEALAAKQEWDELIVEPDNVKEMPLHLRKLLFTTNKAHAIRQRTETGKRWLAAACFLLFMVGMSLLLLHLRSADKQIVATVKPTITIPKAPLTQWQEKVNNSRKALKLNLEDGSVITLFHHATVRYQQPFGLQNRQVFLNGDALFEVAKDKHKPFTVYSGKLSTTALGTSFRVTALHEGKDSIHIALFTGKIVIKSIDVNKAWKQDVYLLPGDALTYYTNRTTWVVLRNKEEEQQKNVGDHVTNTSVSENLSFNNAALAEVLKALCTLHHISITYNDADIEKKNFTGKISKSDDIQSILKLIGQMNDLDVVPTTEGFIMRKSNHP